MSRALKLGLLALLLATGCGQCGACGEEPPAQPAPEPEARAATTVDTPTVEQLPLPQDFGEYAGQRVTADNYQAELARVAAELESAD